MFMGASLLAPPYILSAFHKYEFLFFFNCTILKEKVFFGLYNLKVIIIVKQNRDIAKVVKGVVEYLATL